MWFHITGLIVGWVVSMAWVLYLLYLVSFFFSSRRRHTRFDCDWSSDVCSSDLIQDDSHHLPVTRHGVLAGRGFGHASPGSTGRRRRALPQGDQLPEPERCKSRKLDRKSVV